LKVFGSKKRFFTFHLLTLKNGNTAIREKVIANQKSNSIDVIRLTEAIFMLWVVTVCNFLHA
jgi:hypothetical protein